MRLRRIKAIAKMEILQVRRDPRSLMIVLLMPFVQLLPFGYGVNFDIKHIPICVFDREGSQFSLALLKRFQASNYLQIVEAQSTYHAVTEALDYERCKIAFVIPPDFSERVNDLGQAPVQTIVDATDDNTANIGLGYVQSVVAGFSEVVGSRLSARKGVALQIHPMAIESRVWFNEDLESRNFVIPGVVAMVMALVGAQLTSLTVSREWERGTMETLLSTPVTPMELPAGKIFPYFFIGMLDAAFCLMLAVYWFDVPFRGGLLTVLFTTSMFLIVVIGLGYLISALIRSQIGASQVALLVTLLPTSLLSGHTFPVDQMPKPVQAVTYFVHSRYYVTILKSIFLKGSGLVELGTPILLVTLHALAVLALAARPFRRRLD